LLFDVNDEDEDDDEDEVGGGRYLDAICTNDKEGWCCGDDR
jgi:hypothetical protein